MDKTEWESGMQILQMKDGRKLAYDVYGDPNGIPVIFNHGFSDSRLIRNPDNTLTASLGVRVIAADQPGVGGSSPFRGRKMVDWGNDMEALANFLQIDQFSVVGHSGAALMPSLLPTDFQKELPKSPWPLQ
ncbi:alpha/beta fold hydrolase [Microbulbifer sp. GL-2]|uniref:alpha/beta fold hydrolase n=1 Tax=Microbulbifer sp. GL-2 TaxID=2591606 RepID=UPI001163088A|nr:alpha/beta hydrolase [Microbulbifer sp. GL-2]BBM00284.1 hypothetical protein GL2_03580 [Microbulbifer sp. GL-2]